MLPDREPDGTGRRPTCRPLRRLRFTFGFLAAMLVANLAAGSIGGDLPDEMPRMWGIGRDSLATGDALRLLTGTFLSHDPAMLLRQIAFAAATLGYTEWRRGSGRAAALFFGLDIVGTLVLLALVGWAGGLAHLAAVNDVGMSIGGFGLIGLALAGWRRRWLLLALALLAIAAKYAVAPDPLADLGHGLGLGLGFASGSVLSPPKRNAGWMARHAR